MRLTTLLLFVLFLIDLRSSQAQVHRFEVKLMDKDTNAFLLADHSSFLSSKSIQRRAKQNINITLEDYPVTTSYLDSIQKDFPVKAISKWLNLVVVSTNDSTAINTLLSYSFVKEVNYIGSSSLISARQKKVKSAQKTTLDHGLASDAIQQVKGHHLHNKGFKGEGMTIAVLDGGFVNAEFLTNFSHLRESNRIIAEKNFVIPTNSVYSMDNHGTQVLSVLAALNDGELVGSAPHASYLLLLTEDPREETLLEEYLWIQAAEFADSCGADIINSSLGYNTFDNSTFNHQLSELGAEVVIISNGAKKAAAKGMLVFNSAGNEGNETWKKILFPSDEKTVITVGAVDASGQKTDFSSVGPVDLPFIKPNMAALGHQVIISSSNGNNTPVNGSSFSCPLLAGMGACLWQSMPNKTSAEMKEIMEQSCHQYNNPDHELGFGIPNFKQAYESVLSTIKHDDEVMRVSNPNEDRIRISGSILTKGATTFRLFTLEGVPVLTYTTESTKDITLHLPSLPTAYYLLEIQCETGSQWKKVLISQ